MENLPSESEIDLEINRLRAQYINRLRRVLRHAPLEIREDAVREVQTHIEDEWRVLGGGLESLRTVLEHLGQPEEYGRDLALQLILSHRGKWPMSRLAVAAFFWTTTSLIGSIVVVFSLLVISFAMGMLVVAIARTFGSSLAIIDIRNSSIFGHHIEQWNFPPVTWSPILIGLVGLLPAVIIFVLLYRFLARWVRSRLGQTGLALVANDRRIVLLQGWERSALLAMLAFAVLGLTGCVLFTGLAERIVVGNPSSHALPNDFYRSPALALAYISILVFLLSPFLGLLWAVNNGKSHAKPSKSIHQA
jgi:uncharacterized membrane protein